MGNLINIEIIEVNEGERKDLILEIPELIGQLKFDTYYFALAIEPKKGIDDVKNAIAELIASWNKKIAEMSYGMIIYLPIDLSDQYTGCLKVEKYNDLNLTYGYSMREGWSVDPINPIDFYESIVDFETDSKNTLIVNQEEFEKCLTKLIIKLKSDNKLNPS